MGIEKRRVGRRRVGRMLKTYKTKNSPITNKENISKGLLAHVGHSENTAWMILGWWKELFGYLQRKRGNSAQCYSKGKMKDDQKT